MSGTSSAVTARNIIPLPDSAAVALNTCFLRPRLKPPAKTAAPNTSSRLPRMAPVMDAFTTSSCPLRSAAMAMMSSAALPNEAFISPPSPAPRWWATTSVASPISRASGSSASAHRMNVGVPPRK